MCRLEISATCAITLPILVNTAAKPTTECKAATVCGRSVGVIRRPINAPNESQKQTTALGARASNRMGELGIGRWNGGVTGGSWEQEDGRVKLHVERIEKKNFEAKRIISVLNITQKDYNPHHLAKCHRRSSHQRRFIMSPKNLCFYDVSIFKHRKRLKFF